MGASAAPGCWLDRAGWHRESKASEFPWLLILQHSLMAVLSTLAHGALAALAHRLDSACQGLGLLLMSTAPGSTQLRAGLLQPCFSIPMAGG